LDGRKIFGELFDPGDARADDDGLFEMTAPIKAEPREDGEEDSE
jgi:hypothetical protein